MKYSPAFGLLVCLASAALVVPVRAHAQVTGDVSATAQFESNSNVFDLQSGFAPQANNDTRRSDTDLSYGANFDLHYLAGRQDFSLTGGVNQYEYQHFTQLNNTSYHFDAGLLWKLGEALDGKVDIARTRAMVPFFDLTGTGEQLSLVTTQTESLQIGYKLNSDWKLEGTANTSKTEQPIVGSPDLQQTQRGGTLAIEYQSVGGLTSGLTAGYSTGDYGGSIGTNNPTYSQSTIGFLTSYKVNRMTYEGQIGYTRRSSDTGDNNSSGLTGLLDLKYQLTPKTSFTAKIDRSINSYFLNTSSEIDTEAGVGVTWQATYKLSVTAGYTFTYRDYPGQATNTVSGDRVDIQELANLAMLYSPRPWLVIKPYANLQTRRSTFPGGDFNGTVFGVSITATPWKH